MNKLKYVVYCSVILFIVILGMSYYQFKNLGYYFEHQSGNETLMDNIALSTTVTGSMSQFDIALDNQKLTYEIHDNTYDHTNESYFQYNKNSVHYEVDYILAQAAVLDEATMTRTESDITYEHGVEHINYVSRYIQPSVKAIYKFAKNNEWPPETLLTLEDDMIYYSNDKLVYGLHRYDNNMPDEIYPEEKEGYFYQNNDRFLDFQNDEAIFMATIQPNMKGTASIYKLKRTREHDEVVDVQANKIGEIPVELGTSAIIKVVNDQIFLMKIWEGKLTIDVYTKDFQLLRSLAYPEFVFAMPDEDNQDNQGGEIQYNDFKDVMQAIRIVNNDDYTIFLMSDPKSYDYQLLYVYDDTTYEVIESYRIQTTGIDDVIYKNGYLYRIEPGVRIVQENISIPANNRYVRILKGPEQVYQGYLFINEESPFMPFYNNQSKFRRDEQ